MSASRIKEKPKPRLWAWLTSIRLTVALLLILAAVAVAGVILPQGQPPGFYLSRFGQTWGGLLYLGGFSRLYYSIWFLAPLTLLALNILACLVHGLPQAWRRCFQPFTWETALTLPERAKFSWRPGADPRAPAAGLLRRELGRARHQVQPNREIFFLEKGRWRPLGPYLVHLALLLILAGGLIGKFWGTEGNLPVLQGETVQAFQSGRSKIPLAFQVRLDRFQVLYYSKGGMPKEFRSDLTFLQDGKEMARAVCRVNHPVTFGGLTFYQASYGSQAAGPVRLLVRHGDRKETLEVPERKLVDLPGGQAQIMVLRVDGNFQGFGPAVQLAYKSGPRHPQFFMLFQDHPEMQQPAGPYRFAVESAPYKFYSVFQVKYDPGVWWVYAGFILFLPGFYLAFFRPHQRWALVLEPTSQGGWRGRLLGASPRSREDFEVRQSRLCEELKKVKPL
jgi:cytochrome c biogenesis protein